MPDEPVIKIWSYADCPQEFAQLFPDIDADSWIACVPASLVDTAAIATIFKEAARVTLSDGKVVFSGKLTGSAE